MSKAIINGWNSVVNEEDTVYILGDTIPNIEIGSPNTIHILNILVPTIFPIAISNSPFLADNIVIVSSGRLVPITIIVIAIIFCDIFKASAI